MVSKKKTALVFGVGWLAGNFSLAFMGSYRVLKWAQQSGYDVSSMQSINSELKRLAVAMRFHKELLDHVKENHPEILDDPRFEQYAHDMEFYRITKDL